jgi:hypothetical protein
MPLRTSIPAKSVAPVKSSAIQPNNTESLQFARHSQTRLQQTGWNSFYRPNVPARADIVCKAAPKDRQFSSISHLDRGVAGTTTHRTRGAKPIACQGLTYPALSAGNVCGGRPLRASDWHFTNAAKYNHQSSPERSTCRAPTLPWSRVGSRVRFGAHPVVARCIGVFK